MSKYAATLNFFCSLHLEFLNSLLNKDFFNTLLKFNSLVYISALITAIHVVVNRCLYISYSNLTVPIKFLIIQKMVNDGL